MLALIVLLVLIALLGGWAVNPWIFLLLVVALVLVLDRGRV